MAKIHENLRQLRLERGMTQEQVAGQVGVTRQAVSGYESGRTQPGVDILQRLAGIYQVELADIIYGRKKDRVLAALKITAAALAVFFLAALLVEGLLLWTMNQFFALEPGQLTDAEMAVFEVRRKLHGAYWITGRVHHGVLPIGWTALFVLSLCLRRPLKARTKLWYVLAVTAGAALIELPLGLTDPVFGYANYIYAPLSCLVLLVVFLLLSLVIDFIRARRAKTQQ